MNALTFYSVFLLNGVLTSSEIITYLGIRAFSQEFPEKPLSPASIDFIQSANVRIQATFQDSHETKAECHETLHLVHEVSDCNHEYDHAEKCVLCGVSLDSVFEMYDHLRLSHCFLN